MTKVVQHSVQKIALAATLRGIVVNGRRLRVAKQDISMNAHLLASELMAYCSIPFGGDPETVPIAKIEKHLDCCAACVRLVCEQTKLMFRAELNSHNRAKANSLESPGSFRKLTPAA